MIFLETMKFFTEYEQKIEQLTEDQKLSKRSSDAALRTVERGQHIFTFETEEGDKMQHLCREYTLPRNDPRTRARGWICKNTEIGPVLNIHVCRHEDSLQCRNSGPIFVSRQNRLLGSNCEWC